MTEFNQRGQHIRRDQYNIGRDQIFTGPTYIFEGVPAQLPPAPAQDRHSLSILLEKVKTFWIEGVLDKSIHTTILLDLSKDMDLKSVNHPWERVLELPNSSESLPADKNIGHIFDELNRLMLILGEPGSGKTTTMLDLARRLIEQAEADPDFTQPIPVVLNLASWTNKQSMFDWLLVELSTKYQIPKRIGRQWLQNQRLLLLLDGLDEVKAQNRAQCVEAINAFGETYGLCGLTVCSRLREYTNLPTRLKLYGAVRLQPLSLEEVDKYLAGVGSKFHILRAALKQDASLRELAQSPLMLNLMTLTYQDETSQSNLISKIVEARRNHLFEAYIRQMFSRRGKGVKQYSDQQTIRWLTWLAKRLSQQNHTIFLLENLQPNWLTVNSLQWAYIFGTRLLAALLFGVVLGGVIYVIESLFDIFIFGLIFWPLVSILAGLSVAMVDGVRLISLRNSKSSVTIDRPLTSRVLVVNIIGMMFLEWAIFAAVYWFVGGPTWTYPFVLFLGGASFGLGIGLFWGLKKLKQNLESEIQTTEDLYWYWDRALTGGLIGLVTGAFFGMFWGIVWGLIWAFNSQTFDRLADAFGHFRRVWELGSTEVAILQFTIMFCLIGVLFGGLRGGIQEVKTRPNQGIWLSLRNGGLIGLISGLIVGGSYWLGRSLIHQWADLATVYTSLVAGVLFFMGVSYWYGIVDGIQHYTLRLILWWRGEIPWNYARFLDYATSRIILRKVGGGYIFIHRLLMEHFADLKSE